MKKQLFVICVLSIITMSLAGLEFNPIIVRGNAGVGYTIINLPSALDYDEAYFSDWNQMNVKVNAQGLFLHFAPFSFGVEFGYNLLYYYYVIIPYVPTDIHRERTVSALNLSAIGTYALSDAMSVLAGLGVYFFENGVTFGLKGSFIYTFRINKSMAVPVSAVCDIVFGDGIPIAPGVTVGFEYSFDI